MFCEGYHQRDVLGKEVGLTPRIPLQGRKAPLSATAFKLPRHRSHPSWEMNLPTVSETLSSNSSDSSSKKGAFADNDDDNLEAMTKTEHLVEYNEYAALRACIYHAQDDLRRFRQLVVNADAVMATGIADKEVQALHSARWDTPFADTSVQDESK
eukprot:scaffold293_cov135-Cylindrotheca_fusiformis.AAC.6